MNNRITKLLNIDYPVISAAMNWVTSAEFVAAVSNAGGLGY
ncbi:nitronate monooxygenase [Paenibacillus sonchi]|nr:nitronate monooxygenase [Paenibacillus sonchi]